MLKLLPTFAMLTAITTQPVFAEQQAVTSLQAFQWQHRVIITDQDADNHWVRALKYEDLQLTDRNVVWIVIDSDHQKLIDTNSPYELADELVMKLSFTPYLSAPDSQVVLIGKDGGIKERYRTLDFNALYDDIDAMPMRKREMNQ